MSRFKTYLASVCSLLLLAGCESSDKPTTPLTTGSTNDSNFKFVSEEVVNNQAFKGVDIGLSLSGALIDSLPAPAASRRLWTARPAIENGQLVIESYSYVLQGTWHVFQISGFVATSIPVDTFDLVGVDSIRLMANETPILLPDSTMDGFDYRLHFDSWSRSNSDSLSGSHDVQARLVDSATAKINAELAEHIRFQHSDSLGTCDVSVANSFQASNVLINIQNDVCPLGGSVLLTSAISLDCQGAGGNFSTSVNGVWTIRGYFDGVTENYTYTDGSTLWTSSEACGQAPASMRIW